MIKYSGRVKLVVTAGLALLLLGSSSLLSWAADEVIEVSVDGLLRRALVHLPDNLPSRTKVPALLAFHGSAWSAEVMQEVTGFDALADSEGFIAVYPDGSGPGDVHSWNARSCCSFALESGIDDVAFVSALLDELMQRYPVDPSRIYATGFSNGAMMTYLLGVELTERFAAIAPVSGGMFGTETMPNLALPTMIIHGTGDLILPYDGGWGALRTLSGKLDPILPLSETVEFWREANGCASLAPQLETFRNVVVRTYGGCSQESELVVYTLIDGDHSWPVLASESPDLLLSDPSGDLLSLLSLNGTEPGDDEAIPWDLFETGIDGSAVIWDFFKSHARPSAD